MQHPRYILKHISQGDGGHRCLHHSPRVPDFSIPWVKLDICWPQRGSLVALISEPWSGKSTLGKIRDAVQS
ncbi:hypothetical protein AFLA_010999 [Aspergillus flavus NRRL3357]|nr:hypothetical protein AFLA_010999 [Aspergillus flavus NRRL3357]